MNRSLDSRSPRMTDIGTVFREHRSHPPPYFATHAIKSFKTYGVNRSTKTLPTSLSHQKRSKAQKTHVCGNIETTATRKVLDDTGTCAKEKRESLPHDQEDLAAKLENLTLHTLDTSEETAHDHENEVECLQVPVAPDTSNPTRPSTVHSSYASPRSGSRALYPWTTRSPIDFDPASSIQTRSAPSDTATSSRDNPGNGITQSINTSLTSFDPSFDDSFSGRGNAVGINFADTSLSYDFLGLVCWVHFAKGDSSCSRREPFPSLSKLKEHYGKYHGIPCMVCKRFCKTGIELSDHQKELPSRLNVETRKIYKFGKPSNSYVDWYHDVTGDRVTQDVQDIAADIRNTCPASDIPIEECWNGSFYFKSEALVRQFLDGPKRSSRRLNNQEKLAHLKKSWYFYLETIFPDWEQQVRARSLELSQQATGPDLFAPPSGLESIEQSAPSQTANQTSVVGSQFDAGAPVRGDPQSASTSSMHVPNADPGRSLADLRLNAEDALKDVGLGNDPSNWAAELEQAISRGDMEAGPNRNALDKVILTLHNIATGAVFLTSTDPGQQLEKVRRSATETLISLNIFARPHSWASEIARLASEGLAQEGPNQYALQRMLRAVNDIAMSAAPPAGG